LSPCRPASWSTPPRRGKFKIKKARETQIKNPGKSYKKAREIQIKMPGKLEEKSPGNSIKNKKTEKIKIKLKSGKFT
jgi:hypothetical protein